MDQNNDATAVNEQKTDAVKKESNIKAIVIMVCFILFGIFFIAYEVMTKR